MKNGVVVVTYNRLDLLKECIACIKNQTIPFEKIIIVNNFSDDGTEEYLKEFSGDERFVILNQTENLGGAGGFYVGMDYANTVDLDWVLVIDDDAMIRPDYMEQLMNYAKAHGEVNALAGSVYVDGKVDTMHRRNIVSKLLFLEKVIPKSRYEKQSFKCDCATFCGLLIKGDVMRRIGLPKREYFIWYDDSEYSLRLQKYGRITTIPKAILDHKTTIPQKSEWVLDRTGWRHYYGYRNRYDTARRHFGKLSAGMIALQYHFLRAICFVMLLNPKKREHAKFNIEMIKDVLNDGKNQRLGFCDKYHR